MKNGLQPSQNNSLYPTTTLFTTFVNHQKQISCYKNNKEEKNPLSHLALSLSLKHAEAVTGFSLVKARERRAAAIPIFFLIRINRCLRRGMPAAGRRRRRRRRAAQKAQAQNHHASILHSPHPSSHSPLLPHSLSLFP